jgi:phosphoribosylamine--glycine ligase
LEAVAGDAVVFHAGTARRDGALVTRGGRVLTVTGLGPDLAAARRAAYASVERISFEGMQYRRDIGAQEANL